MKRKARTKKAPQSYQRHCEDLSPIFVRASEAVYNGLIDPENLSRKDVARFALMMISSYGLVPPQSVQKFAELLEEDNKDNP